MARKTAVPLNPNFDSRMLSIGAPNLYDPATGKQIKNTIRRGWLVNYASKESPAPGGVIGRVNFMYNPSEVNVSHTANPDMATTDQVTAAQNKGLQATEGTFALSPLGTLSISLLFDRTYELWDSSYKGTVAGTYGVYADILALYKMFGMVSHTIDARNSNKFDSDMHPTNVINFNLFPTLPLMYPIIYTYLGPSSLKFFGAVVGYNVNYTHWSRGMIPMRAGVDLTVNLMPDPGNKGNGGSTWVPATLASDTTNSAGTTKVATPDPTDASNYIPPTF